MNLKLILRIIILLYGSFILHRMQFADEEKVGIYRVRLLQVTFKNEPVRDFYALITD